MARAPEQSMFTRSSILTGLVAGLAHTALAVLLWNHWFDDLFDLIAVKPLNGAYILLGMFLLGFVPALFYVGEKVKSPAAIIAVLLLLSGLGSWLAGPVRPPSAVPTPFALYILSWIGVVALAGVIGGFEYRRKQRATK
ncbi:hypothetical protein [Haloferax sp. DFSO52]|uniref:hypothetical protein n=1 Tax=Haloferax sp. DFSO52 TaxID=3388505 RepID=UPI003A845415